MRGEQQGAGGGTYSSIRVAPDSATRLTMVPVSARDSAFFSSPTRSSTRKGTSTLTHSRKEKNCGCQYDCWNSSHHRGSRGSCCCRGSGGGGCAVPPGGSTISQFAVLTFTALGGAAYNAAPSRGHHHSIITYVVQNKSCDGQPLDLPVLKYQLPSYQVPVYLKF